MKVEVFGAGCARCENTYKTFINAAAELGLAADITYITDVNVLADRGIVRTPAIYVDGVLVIQGRAPTAREVKDILQGKEPK